MTAGSKVTSLASAKSNKDTTSLWIEKHAPTSLDDLVVNRKKIKEFTDIVEENGGGGFLVLHGPPGSCKNALISAFCASKGVKLIRFSDAKT